MIKNLMFDNPEKAFKKLIAVGCKADRFMYMYSDLEYYYFKNKMTRKYIKVKK